MRVIFRSTVAAAALLTISLAAHAADLPMAPMYQPAAAPAAVQQVYNWTGIYFGFNGGYTFGQSTPMSLYSDSYTAFNYDANGGFGGLTAGAQIQSGHTVIGVEGDIDWASISGSSSGPIFLNGNILRDGDTFVNRQLDQYAPHADWLRQQQLADLWHRRHSGYQ